MLAELKGYSNGFNYGDYDRYFDKLCEDSMKDENELYKDKEDAEPYYEDWELTEMRSQEIEKQFDDYMWG